MKPSSFGSNRACQAGDPLFELWLPVCTGFSVHTSHRRLGVVKQPVQGKGAESTLLVVVTGFMRRNAIEIRAEEIEWILPQGRRLLLKAPSMFANPDEIDSKGVSGSRVNAPMHGYAARSLAGARVGTVAAIIGDELGEELVIEAGVWPFRHYRGLALSDALVRHADRTVVALAPTLRLRHGQAPRRRQRAFKRPAPGLADAATAEDNEEES